jgi:Na+-transporting methylmalonyl-CoA/oxaloacetate decarboxylase beta subunit
LNLCYFCPIGFGAILTNIPEIGLALSPIEKLIYFSNSEELAGALSLVVLGDAESLSAFLKTASHSQLWLLNEYAAELGYKPGILNTFYSVAIGSGVAPLVIFMGVGAMTDFGPMLANPKTLILGAAAQFGIFATVIGALLLNELGIVSFTLKASCGNWNYWRSRWPNCNLCFFNISSGTFRCNCCCSILIHGFSTFNSASDNEILDHKK